MTKSQALYKFWSSFGLKAYDEYTVPTGADAPVFPYITYQTATDGLDNKFMLNASIYYKSTSWTGVTNKAEEIAEAITKGGTIKLDNGYLKIWKGTPFAQRSGETVPDNIKRILLNIEVEFLTSY